jgi:hypothetical protein
MSHAHTHTYTNPDGATPPVRPWRGAGAFPPQEYESVAVRLAQAPHLLWALRRRIAARRGTNPLFHHRTTTGHLERAYQCMWDVRLAQLVGRHDCGREAADAPSPHMRAPQACWRNNATLTQYRDCMQGWHPLHIVVTPAAAAHGS